MGNYASKRKTDFGHSSKTQEEEKLLRGKSNEINVRIGYGIKKIHPGNRKDSEQFIAL